MPGREATPQPAIERTTKGTCGHCLTGAIRDTDGESRCINCARPSAPHVETPEEIRDSTLEALKGLARLRPSAETFYREYVCIMDLVTILVTSKPTLVRWCKRNQIAVLKMRHPEHGQNVNVVTTKDAKQVVKAY